MARLTIDFGIDLGTTNSTVAVIDGVSSKVIPNKVGSGITPSAVYINKRGDLRVGEDPKLRAATDPDNGDMEFKLRMGMGPEGAKRFVASGRSLSPEELSAEVLKSLKLDVQTSLNEDLRAAVVTIPAAFENPSMAATARAAQLAGLTLCPLLLEPVAASLAYGFQTESDNVYWFVFDFGGGTFDAAVMRIRDGQVQVVNHDGNNFLGGKLLDWDIVTKKLVPAITGQFNLPEFKRGNPRWANAISLMKYHAEQLKIEVCRSRAPADMLLENLCEDADGNPVDFAYRLTPQDVEEISQPYIEQSLALAAKALRQAGLQGSDMERVLMVGGSTLNPWLRDAVQSELGARVEFSIDPVTVVARGAAIFASTQVLPHHPSEKVPSGTWRIKIDHKPVGNTPDPDIGGMVVVPEGQSAEGFSIEFVDTKSTWRSGRLTLGRNGVFMTQLYAEKQSRHEFAIELCNATGSRLETEPESVSYTIGVVPEEHPPAAKTIGVGLADGNVAVYFEKGARLPAHRAIEHVSTQRLRAGHEADALRIPVLEGEHALAKRNHNIGTLIIKGTDIVRDLPAGSEIEITLDMDTSQQISMLASVKALDESFSRKFDAQTGYDSRASLVEEMQRQFDRLAAARAEAEKVHAQPALAALARIDEQGLVDQIGSLRDAAATEADAVVQLDRRIRELAAALDEVDGHVRWPALLQQCEGDRVDARRIVDEYGEALDKTRLAALETEFQRAVDSGDPDLLERVKEDLLMLRVQVLERHPAFHGVRFRSLAERSPTMRSPEQAKQLIARGESAVANNDLAGLKSINRQLAALLPEEGDPDERDKNRGGTLAMK